LQRLAGLAIGFAGIVVLVWPELTPDLLPASAAQMVFAGMALLSVGILVGEWRAVTFSSRTAAALAHLVVVGSVVGYLAYAYALKHLPLATVSLYAYANPVIAVAVDPMLDEPFDSRLIIGAAVILAGSDRQCERTSLDNPSAAHQADEEQHDRDDQQYVNEVPERVAADDAEQPEHDPDDRNGFQHVQHSSKSSSATGPAVRANRLQPECRGSAEKWRSAVSRTILEGERHHPVGDPNTSDAGDAFQESHSAA
jgi:hypothetical protein